MAISGARAAEDCSLFADITCQASAATAGGPGSQSLNISHTRHFIHFSSLWLKAAQCKQSLQRIPLVNSKQMSKRVCWHLFELSYFLCLLRENSAEAGILSDVVFCIPTRGIRWMWDGMQMCPIHTTDGVSVLSSWGSVTAGDAQVFCLHGSNWFMAKNLQENTSYRQNISL